MLEMEFFVVDHELSMTHVPDFAGWAFHFNFLAGPHGVKNVAHGTPWLGVIRKVCFDHKIKGAVFFLFQDRTSGCI